MYNRILLKLSGEALMGDQDYGINLNTISGYCEDIKKVVDKKVQIAIVVGGGNIYRGLQGVAKGMDRVQGDYMGMLATVINSMALQAELEKINIKIKLLSGLYIDTITETTSSRKAEQYLNDGYVVIIAGGTGNPFFTTDSASALRAIEINADVLMKGTRVDGIYSADPEKDSSAVKYKSISFDEAYSKNLKIMDMTAFTLCKENKLPILVFDMNITGNLLKAVMGNDVGTIVKANM